MPMSLEDLPNPDKLFDSWYPILIGIAVGVLYGFRAYFRGSQCLSTAKLKGKTAIVTGASSGIGQSIALDLARRGAKVIIACRNEQDAKEAVATIKQKSKVNNNVVVMKLDLTSFKSIRQFVEDFKKEETDLHILVNNAGVMMSPQKLTEDKFDEQFQVNYLGHFLLTHLLLDMLKKSAPSRVVNISAPAYALAAINFADINGENDPEYNTAKQFAQSKLAVMLFTLELSKRLQDTDVKVYSANPGVTNSNVHRHMLFKSNAFVRFSLSPFVWFFMKSSEDGAQVPLYCAVTEGLEKCSGKYYSECAEKTIEPNALDEDMAKKLNEESRKWTRLYDTDTQQSDDDNTES